MERERGIFEAMLDINNIVSPNFLFLKVIKKSLLNNVLVDLHCNSGHLGRDKTIKRAKSIFYWKNMTNDIKEFISGCEKCHKSKKIAKMELHPIPVTSFFHRIGIDLVGELVETGNHNK